MREARVLWVQGRWGGAGEVLGELPSASPPSLLGEGEAGRRAVAWEPGGLGCILALPLRSYVTLGGLLHSSGAWCPHCKVDV